jgi:hypothetical protein
MPNDPVQVDPGKRPVASGKLIIVEEFDLE